MKKRIAIYLSVFISMLSIQLKGQSIEPAKDIEGNNYKVVKIGKQIWFGENLKTTLYNDSTKITLISDKVEWNKDKDGAYCSYEYHGKTYEKEYGYLYNYYSVKTQKLCPIGWHVPSIEEWDELIEFLGGKDIAGGKLKSTTKDWWSNVGGTDEVRFSALPGGYRWDGRYNYLRNSAYWWTSTEKDENDAYYRGVNMNQKIVTGAREYKEGGFSIRCIKD